MAESKATATTDAAGKQDGKKDENFLMKTAHSIRSKVQEFTDDVKEMAHNLKRGDEPKKSKTKDKNKTTDSKAGTELVGVM
jgi:gas vesicle protein